MASADNNTTTLAEKVAFLSRPDAYPHCVDNVTRRETHMSWVFLAGDRVYKLKKPVRFPYLDFATLERRETACRAEVSLNRRLAPDIYLGTLPLTVTANVLCIGGTGTVADWLVVMRRLDSRWALDRALREGASKDRSSIGWSARWSASIGTRGRCSSPLARICSTGGGT